ncbi:MarR family transcriptional regulator [Novosphingobium sp. JCM 18896]|nr:MarR family transcriptional regulator [Novosphingobium sp. JCM 18896]
MMDLCLSFEKTECCVHLFGIRNKIYDWRGCIRRVAGGVIEPRTEFALRAIRRLLRSADLSERRLAAATGLTPSQLVVLQEVAREGETTAGGIATAVQFSQATVTSIVDRLVERSFVVRSRREKDRRKVWVTITAEGQEILSSAPDVMQDRFQQRFSQLADWEQAMIVAMLERLSAVLDADGLEAAPVIDAGIIDRIAPD